MEKSELIQYIKSPQSVSPEHKKQEILNYCLRKGKEKSLSERFIRAVELVDDSNPFGFNNNNFLNQVFSKMLEMCSKELGVSIVTDRNNTIIKIF